MRSFNHRSRIPGAPEIEPYAGRNSLRVRARGDGPPPANAVAADALVAAAARLGGPHGPPRVAVGDPIDRLPETAARKLRALRATNEDLTVVIRDLSERRNFAVQAKTASLVQVEHLKRELATLPHMGPPAEHPSLKEAVVRLQNAERDIAQLDQRIAALRAQRPSELRRIEDYLTALPPGAVEAHADPIEPKIGKGGIAVAIESIRETIARIAADIHAAESAARPAADVKRRMVAQVEALADRGTPNVCNSIEAGLDIAFPMLDIRAPLTGHAASEGAPQLMGFASHSTPDALGLICWLFKDQLISALSDESDALADDANALDDETRATNVATLQSAKLEAERFEERLIEIAAEESRIVARRPNADPRAIMGLASSLPGPRQ
jgi:hypothetical protein